MIEWKDASSFSQGDKVRTPNCWRISGGGVTITLHRHIYYEKDDWLVSCEPWFQQKLLKSKDVDEAKAEALQKVRAALSAAHDAFLDNAPHEGPARASCAGPLDAVVGPRGPERTEI